MSRRKQNPAQLLIDPPPLDLPGLEFGRGERRTDCRHYAVCLDRHIRSTFAMATSDDDKPARCTIGCKSYSPLTEYEKLAMACDASRGDGPIMPPAIALKPAKTATR